MSIQWTYSGDPSASDRDAVRFRIGDTDEAEPLLADAEIDWLLAEQGTVLPAAIEACRAIAARYARKCDKSVGPVSISYSQRSQHYRDLAAEIAHEAGLDVPLVAPVITGQSASDMEAQRADGDWAQGAALRIGMTDYPDTRVTGDQ
jgi:hypothetical protein